MNAEGFWQLIEQHLATDDDGETPVDGLVAALAQLDAGDVIKFDRLFRQHMANAYSWRLWGAAYLIGGGCSDDGFEYFRGWLIAQGRAAFEAAIADPDTLAERALPEICECEDLLYVASDAFEQQGSDEDLPFAEVPLPELGEGWDFDDDEQMKARYPRLFQRFASEG